MLKRRDVLAGECTSFIHYGIPDKCVGFTVCVVKYPTKGINDERRQKHKIDV